MPRKRKRGTLGRQTIKAKKAKLIRSQEIEEIRDESLVSTCDHTEARTNEIKESETVEIHSDDKNDLNELFQCNECDQILTSSFNLKRHLKIHTGEKKLSVLLVNKLL